MITKRQNVAELCLVSTYKTFQHLAYVTLLVEHVYPVHKQFYNIFLTVEIHSGSERATRYGVLQQDMVQHVLDNSRTSFAVPSLFLSKDEQSSRT